MEHAKYSWKYQNQFEATLNSISQHNHNGYVTKQLGFSKVLACAKTTSAILTHVTPIPHTPHM